MTKLLSLCMIVRDEEKVLERCLESVQGLVDEIIIVDTGSVDSTKEIARKYTDQIYDFTWINDFAAAKNEAISKATGKWILSLDADEYVVPEDHKALKEYLLTLDHNEPVGIILPIFNITGSGKNTKLVESSACRLFPNHEDIIFYRPIHEQIKHKTIDLPFIRFKSLKIFHTGYTAEVRGQKDKSSRNMKIFESLAVKTEYDYFTLGNEYMILNDLKKAIYYYQRAYHKADKNQDWIMHCTNQMVNAYMSLDRFKEAFELADESLSMWPYYSDYYFYKGFIYEYFGFDNEAIEVLKQSIQIAEKPIDKKGRFWLTTPSYGSTLPYTLLSKIYLNTNDNKNAILYITKLLKLDNQDSLLLYRYLNLLLPTESIPSIISLLKQFFDHTEEKNILRLLQLSLLTGNKELCGYYFDLFKTTNQPISSAYYLHYAIIFNDRNLFNSCMNPSEQEADSVDNNKLYCLAACIWKDSSYLSHLKSGDNTSSFAVLGKLLSRSLSNQELVIDEKTLDIGNIIVLLTELFKLQYFETYDWVISLFPDYFDSLAQSLGDYFFSMNEFELALDYYSILLSKDKLSSFGYENVGRLYFNQGVIDEGLEFLEKALDLNSRNIKLYHLFIQNCQDTLLKEKIKNKFLNEFPQHKGLPFIQKMLKD